jgi:hypothetical protein
MRHWDIPDLDILGCAEALVPPVAKWGSLPAGGAMPGTWHFYTYDYLFRSLLVDPFKVGWTGCQVAIEPNFSTDETMSPEQICWLTACKRRIARVWQAMGLKIIVDLNVSVQAREFNLIGVPRGWSAYATRKHRGVSLAEIEVEHQLAVEHAGTDQILFVVVGGGQKIKAAARRMGWPWVPEHFDVVKGKEPAYENGERDSQCGQGGQESFAVDHGAEVRPTLLGP